jgi:heparin binding hemagglutinin HbhA
MTHSTDTRKTSAGNKPLYAAAGAGDLAVAKLRELPGKAKTTAQERLDSFGETAGDTYDDLVVRGRSVVRRIRGQRATEELVEQAQATLREARRTRQTARRAAGRAGADKIGS